MASAPPTSPDGSALPAADGVVTGEAAFAARLGRRAAPVVRTPLAASAMRGPGRLASTFTGFNRRLGLSQTSRWTLEAAAETASDATVRPPIDYWPWDADEPAGPADGGAAPRAAEAAARPPRPAVVDDEPDDFVSSGDARLDALRRMLDKQKKPRRAAATPPTADRPARSAAAATPARSVRRGLPQVLHRRGTAARRAQPGDMARRLRPAPVDPRAVGQRAATGAVPTNLPAAAAQARAAESADRSTDAPTRQAAERRRPPEGPRPGRPSEGRPSPTASARPAMSPVTPAAPRRPVDLADAARRLPAAPHPGGPGAPAVRAPADASSSRPTDDRTRPGASPRPPAGPAASVQASHGASPAAASTSGSAQLRDAVPAAQDATIRRTTGEAPQGARDPMPRVAVPTPVADRTMEPRSATTAPQADGPRPTAPLRPSGPSASAPDRVADRRSTTDSSPSTTPPWAIGRALSERPGARDQAVAELRSAPRALDTGTPRPPVASAATTSSGEPSADGRGPAPAPAPSPGGLGAVRVSTARVAEAPALPGTDPTRAPAGRPVVPNAVPTGPGATSPSSSAPSAVAAEPVRRAPSAGPSVGAAMPGLAERPPVQGAELAREMPGAVPPSDAVGRPARTVGDAPSARRAPNAARSDWPVQRSVGDPTPQVDLSARTRPPAGPTAAEPAARRHAHDTPGTDAGARPAPPLAPRLRAVDLAGPAVGTAPTTPAPSARYRPTWQGGELDGEPGPPTTGHAAPSPAGASPPAGAPAPDIRRTTNATASVDAPTPTAAAPSPSIPRSASPPSTVSATAAPSPASRATPSSPASASPPPDDQAATVAANAAPNPASRATPSSPASASPPPDDQAATVRRAPVGDASVRPATAFAADVAADLRPRAAHAAPQTMALGANPVTPRPESPPPNRPGANPVTPRPESPLIEPIVAARGDADGTTTVPWRPAPPAVRRTAAEHGADARPWNRADQGPVDIDAGRHSPADAPVRRFESVLRRTPAAPAPLPVQWRPLASAIAGQRRVRVSTNAASRAALQAAGKRAATTGDVIHLARPLRGAADAAVLAHELTHVASPSPAARFFDDDRDSPEERRAEMIADVIRRSPVLPRAGAGATTADLPVSRSLRSTLAGARTRRPPAGGATPSVTADELVRRFTDDRSANGEAGTIRRAAEVPSRSMQASGASSPMTAPPVSRSRRNRSATRDASTIRRTVAGGTRSVASSAGAGAAAETIRRWNTATPASTTRSSNGIGGGRDHGAAPTTAHDGNTGDTAGASTPNELRTRSWPVMSSGTDSSSLRDLMDWIVEQVEDRVTRELERRGGRYGGEF